MEPPQAAADHLFAVVYDHLRTVARRELRKRQRGGTLDTTALVNEAYLKISQGATKAFRDRGHFLAVASLAMRHILVDAARRRAMKRRHGETSDDGALEPSVEVDELAAEVLALDQALAALSALDERLARLVELRFFGGLSVEDTARTLEVSERTVKRDWQKARAFLFRALREGRP